MQYKNKWIVRADHVSMRSDPVVREISEKLNISIPTSQLLVNRGCTMAEEAERFIAKKDEHLHDPFLMKDMNLAAERVVSALENEEKIVIFGDYDVDGVTSVSCLYLYLKSYGADVSYYIPCRAGEGYGVSETAVRKLAESGVNLIITVDTGITAAHEAAVARELGVDMVITDHHECHS
jgi:single-stranded-DNA-specific exonuclease